MDAVTDESDTTNNCSTSVRITLLEPDLVVGSPSVSDGGPVAGAQFHAVGDGEERWCRIWGGDDVALLPVVGRDDLNIGYGGGQGPGSRACRFGEQQPVGGRYRTGGHPESTTTERAWTR